jgi:hypothetical protein
LTAGGETVGGGTINIARCSELLGLYKKTSSNLLQKNSICWPRITFAFFSIEMSLKFQSQAAERFSSKNLLLKNSLTLGESCTISTED